MATAQTTKTTEPTTVKAAMSAEEALAAVRSAELTNVNTVKAPEINDRGFTRVFDKNSLVKKPFTIVDWEDNVEDFGWTATVHIVTASGKALFFKDGSTGIYQQLKDLKKTGLTTMIACPKGLRVSEYENPYGDGMSHTFYLDDSVTV